MILQSWFWLVAIISSWGRANRAVMLWWFGAKKGQNKSSGSKSRARITSCSSGPADAGRLTPALCVSPKLDFRIWRVCAQASIFSFNEASLFIVVVNSTGFLLQRAAPGWAH